VRHPIYLAHLCTIAAFTIGSGMAVNYALLGFAIVTGAVMVRLEEKELAGRFGDDWRDYKRRVPAIIPHKRRTTAQFTTSPNQAIAKSQNEI
jgi:protein-S-isoprenylcysteine O-methyltransferase Ste14